MAGDRDRSGSGNLDRPQKELERVVGPPSLLKKERA